MKFSKNLLIKSILIIILAILISPLYFVFQPKNNTEYHDIVSGSKIEEANFGQPIKIVIPKLSVDAKIEYVGILADGTMGVPKGPNEVAWYSLGVAPGTIGNSVMAGHSGWKNNLPAVFDKLDKLKKGDKIIIEDVRGMTITFIVSGSQSYEPTIDAKEIFIGSDGKSHLNLITCTGLWDQSTNSHNKRLVVFADLE